MERFLLELADLMAKHNASLGFDPGWMDTQGTKDGSGVAVWVGGESVTFSKVGGWDVSPKDVSGKVKQMMKKD